MRKVERARTTHAKGVSPRCLQSCATGMQQVLCGMQTGMQILLCFWSG